MMAPRKVTVVRNYALELLSKPIHEACIKVNRGAVDFECIDKAFNEGKTRFCDTPTVLDPFSGKLCMKLWSNDDRHTKLANNMLECCCFLCKVKAA